MKKLISLVLAALCMLGLLGCSNKETKVWDWAQGLTQESILAATPWRHDEEHKGLDPLNATKTLELVTLLNKLTKDSFTENKHLAGITPTFGIQIKIASETYNINFAPSPYGKYGTLEIGYDEKMWWIDNAELSDFVQSVTGTTATEQDEIYGDE